MGFRIPEVEDRRAHLCKPAVCVLAPLALDRESSKNRIPNTNNRTSMAIYHLSVKTISRSAGRSSTAAAAYRAGVEITDDRDGEIHDYRRKLGVDATQIFLPAGAPDWATDRAKLWNAVEESETRKNSTVAREFEVSLPSELTAEERRELAYDFATALVSKYGLVADVSIHQPRTVTDKDLERDPHQHVMIDPVTGRRHNGNFHAHILCSTRRLGAEGFGSKTRELDDRTTGANQVIECRELFARMTNDALERAGHSARVDHRTLEAQGIDRVPTIHLGPAATAIERRGEVSQKTLNHQERQQEAERKVAATVAIAQAQAKAAEITAEKEKQNDRVRNAAIAAIARAGRATDNALAFASADHAATENAQRAISGDASISKGLLFSARDSLRASRDTAKNYEPNIERAIAGAERRVIERNLDLGTPAVAKQLGKVGRVIQQFSARISLPVRTFAQAVTTVVADVAKRLQKKSQMLANALTDIDRQKIDRIDELIDRAAKGDAWAMKNLPSAFDKLKSSLRLSNTDHMRLSPKPFQIGQAQEDAKRARKVEAQLEVNAKAKARGITEAVPYPEGYKGEWQTAHYSSYETALKQAQRDVVHHSREPRPPEGFWKRKEAAAYDSKTTELQGKASGWEKEIKWRDGAFEAASKRLEPRDQAYIEAAKLEHKREQAGIAEKAELSRARRDAQQRELGRLRDKMGRSFSPSKQREYVEKERGKKKGPEI